MKKRNASENHAHELPSPGNGRKPVVTNSEKEKIALAYLVGVNPPLTSEEFQDLMYGMEIVC